MSALKYNQNKPQLRYLSQGFLNETAYAMMAGAKKYGPYNYYNGHEASSLVEAAVRHMYKYLNGEEYDQDCSTILGQPVSHLGCAAANINMLLAQIEAGTLIDDTSSPRQRVEKQDLFSQLDIKLDSLIKEFNEQESKQSANYLGYLDDHSAYDLHPYPDEQRSSPSKGSDV